MSEVAARLIFELVIPQGAEVVGTYTADFYAGTPAVTRHAVGAGHAWYVGAGLDEAGVAWLIGHVLDGHGLRGPSANVPGLETAARVTAAGERLRFLLNHGASAVEFRLAPGGLDLLTGHRVGGAWPVRLEPYGVLIVREDGVG